MGRSPCCEKIGLKKGPWTPEEDQKLLAYIEEHGHGSWRALPAKAGLQRCGKSCRLRWTNYLRPDIKRGKFSMQEEQTIIQLHALLGNRWSAIATHLPKRTDNEIKNYWNTHLKKRLAKMGIDPVTHKPKSDTLSSADGHSKNTANLSHMAQWESARLEAEARLVRESKLRVASSSSPFHSQQQDRMHQQHMGTSSPTSSTTSMPPPALPPAVPSSCIDVLRALQGVWPTKPTVGQGTRIDLESPTSTLSFSENNILPAVSIGLLDSNNPMSRQHHQGTEDLEAENAEWKCTRKQPVCGASFEGREKVDAYSSDFSLLDPMASFFGGEAPWLSESSSSLIAGRSSGEFGLGFTGMLIDDNSNEEQNSSDGCGDSVIAEGGSCMEDDKEGEGEKSKNYWNSILHLVNSSPSSSPPVF